jgi:hypothetical protein
MANGEFLALACHFCGGRLQWREPSRTGAYAGPMKQESTRCAECSVCERTHQFKMRADYGAYWLVDADDTGVLDDIVSLQPVEVSRRG